MLLERTVHFKSFLIESFQNGILRREMRLSPEELNIVQQTFPNAVIKKLKVKKAADGKAWYEVNLQKK